MKLILTAALGALVMAGDSPAGSSDLTLRTRSTYAPRGRAVETVTLQIKGTRQRYVRQTDLSGVRTYSITQILQCDLGRVLIANDMARIYSIEPLRLRRVRTATAARDDRPVAETRILDAVDTGERRAVGPLSARHIVTTTTMERADAAPKVIGVRDGWYLDVPRDCDESPAMSAVLARRDSGRVEVKWRGTAKTGFPIEERDRMGIGVERKTELLDVSTATISAAAFEVPDGYRPAVPLPGGGYDLTRPDTLVNRVSVLWRAAANWVSSFWQ